MEPNTFAIFMKAFIEKFHGARPDETQWECFKKILNDVPTVRLRPND
jgi:hypothetical protein